MMKKLVLKNKEIYRIGDKVLKSVRLSDEEIDRIVAAPHLVDQVRAAMESGQVVAEPDGISNDWPLRYTLRRQNAWAAAFAAVLIFAGTIGIIGIAKQYYSAPELARTIPQQVPPVEIPRIALAVAQLPGPEAAPAGPHKVIKPRRRETTQVVKTSVAFAAVSQPKEIEMGEFQALSYAGDPEEPGENGRIVRVELSRASLYAMGVDVAVENETGKIKADLLIGFDGVMRGVRVEKRN